MSTNLFERYAQLDPANESEALPDWTPVAPVLLAVFDERTESMTTQQTKPEMPAVEKDRRGWLVGVAAFAAVLIAGAVTAGVLQTSNRDTALPEIAPVSVVVPATEQWTDTGIDVSIGDTVLIDADGTLKPAAYETAYGPDGAINRPSARQYNIDGLEEANHVALIGRIGEAGAPFVVGSELLFEADTEGRLFLGINDQDVANNVGELSAIIAVTPS